MRRGIYSVSSDWISDFPTFAHRSKTLHRDKGQSWGAGGKTVVDLYLHRPRELGYIWVSVTRVENGDDARSSTQTGALLLYQLMQMMSQTGHCLSAQVKKSV